MPPRPDTTPPHAHNQPVAPATPGSGRRTRPVHLALLFGAAVLTVVGTGTTAAGSSGSATTSQPGGDGPAHQAATVLATSAPASPGAAPAADRSPTASGPLASLSIQERAAQQRRAEVERIRAAEKAAAERRRAAKARAEAARKAEAERKAAAARKAEAERARKAREAAKAKAARAKRTAKSWVRPLSGYRISAYFGQSGSRWSRSHTGLDFAAPSGKVVRSVGAGVVESAGWAGAYGNRVVIRHKDGTRTSYSHLSKITRRSGTVSAGTAIGRVGTTGNSTGPHLHLEVRPGGGSPVDPLVWLRRKGVRV